jgi:hypothetical protein
MKKAWVLILVMVFVAACSDDNKVAEGEHVWKEQTEMIDKAKDIVQLINDAAQQQRREIVTMRPLAP